MECSTCRARRNCFWKVTPSQVPGDWKTTLAYVVW